MSDFDENMLLDDEEEDTQSGKYLLFHIGREVMGISIKHVTEIIELQTITEVPDMPAYIRGVINLRGKVIPVMDLRLRFGLEPREFDDRTCIVNVKIKDILVGFIVDTVAEVHDIPDVDIEPPLSFKSVSGSRRYISGLARVGEEVKILLDVEKILFEEEIEALAQGV